MSPLTKPSKTNLIHEIQAGYLRFERLVQAVPSDLAENPGLPGSWSVRDTLVHLATWERLTLVRLEAALAGARPGIPPVGTDREIDTLNEHIRAESKRRTFADSRHDFKEAHVLLMAMVENLDETFFLGLLPAEWGRGREVWRLIGANTCWHYPEHAEAIKKWLASP